MLNDLFEELKEIISENVVYSEDNKNEIIRIQNRNRVEDIIVSFFNTHIVYKEKIRQLYNKDFMEIIDNIIDTFVFSMLLDEKKTYKDKKSIAYTTNPSPFDIFKRHKKSQEF